MVSSSTEKTIVTYADALRSMNSSDVRADLDSACEQLAWTAVRLMENFDHIAKQLHTIDMLTSTPPSKSQWDSLRKDFMDLLWNFRNNAGFISGRLKMFCTVVLPLAARNSTSSRSHNEKLQVLGSFMSISADHAALTRNLVGSAMKFNSSLNTFHMEFLKTVSHGATGGQRELRKLAHKLTDLESSIRQVCTVNASYSGSDVTHFAFSVYRGCGSSKRKASRSRTLHQQLVLSTPELVSLGRLYEQLDLIRNEVAHAQYTAEVCQRKTDVLSSVQTMMSSLVCDEMISIESGFSLFLSVWSRLHADCTVILDWVQNTRTETPGVIIGLMNGNCTLYATVADALDTLLMGIDSSHFAKA
ncbi:hypothetical protein E4T56_gene19240 [Termitomyces sp. T112]|nr:hypothetical protein E4T56_gene19240 [Termitomyces sp. T112]